MAFCKKLAGMTYTALRHICLTSIFIALPFASYTSSLCIFIDFKMCVYAGMQSTTYAITHQYVSTEMHSFCMKDAQGYYLKSIKHI